MTNLITNSLLQQEKTQTGWRDQVAAQLVARDPGYASAADKFLQCGHKIVAALTCPNQINHHARPIFEHCDLRICPRCAPRLSARLLDHYLPAVQQILADHAAPGRRVRHVVLTTDIHPLDANSEAHYYHARVRVLSTFRDCLCPRRDGEAQHAWDERWAAKKRTIGLIVVDDVGETNRHWHFHVFYFGPFIPWAVLSQVWQTLTGYPIVYIHNRQDQPVKDTLQEVLKYVTKFTAHDELIDPRIAAAIFDTLHGCRRVRSYGLFFGIPAMPDEDNEHGQCPECQAALEPIKIGKFLQRTHDYLLALEFDETTPDLSHDVLCIVAAAATCSHLDVMFTAVRQWQQIWSGLTPRPYSEYTVSADPAGLSP